MKRKGGVRRKTRSKLSKKLINKGKISLRSYFATYKNGDKVVLKAESAVQKGMYLPRYHGKEGTIVGKRGRSYEVRISDHTKSKVLIVHPVHLKKGA